MKDRFEQFTDRELDLIWEALSAFDAGERELIENNVKDLFQEAARVRRVRARKKSYPPLGNRLAESGCDRCECGCKYWEGDMCIDCGTEFDPQRHRIQEGVG